MTDTTTYEEEMIIQENMRAVADCFSENDVKFTVFDENTLTLSFGGFDNIAHLQLALIFDSKPSMQVRTIGYTQAQRGNILGVLEIINEINSRYRFVKMYVDTDDGEIVCEQDVDINTETAGFTAREVIARMHHLCDEIYPKLMHAIWAGD